MTAKLFLIFFILLFFTSCNYTKIYDSGKESGYKDGYAKGYEKGSYDGYTQGYGEGYEHGADDGYRDGYFDGTAFFLESNSMPSVGLIVLFFTLLVLLYFSYRYLTKPTKRLIDEISHIVEEKREKQLVERELMRKQEASEELARARAKSLSSKVYERAKLALAESMSKDEFEKLRVDTELKIFEIQLKEIYDINKTYKNAVDNIENIENATAKEKLNLYRLIKEILK